MLPAPITALIVLSSLTLQIHAALVKQTLDITWGAGAPNGQQREMVFVNGSMPGPEMIFNEDDDVEIMVRNFMPQGVTVHYHGLSMHGTPWSDGVPGLSQPLIHSNGSYIYRFKASPAGTHWYHAHVRQLLVDGLHGAIFIRPKPSTDLPFHLISDDKKDLEAMRNAAANPKLLVISDWDQYTSDAYWKATLDSQLMLFCVDSILMNGKGSVFCPGQNFLIEETAPGIQEAIGNSTVSDKGCLPFVSAVDEVWLDLGKPDRIPPNLQSGCIPSAGSRETIRVNPADGWVSLNWISAATYKTPQPSIDEHDMWIYEVDGAYVEPVKVQAFNMWAGERFSVMVKLDKPVGRYTVSHGDYGGTQVLGAYADLVYDGEPVLNRPSIAWTKYGGTSNIVGANIFSIWEVFNDTLAPFPAKKPAAVADQEMLFYMGRTNSSYHYTMTGASLYPLSWDERQPLLLHPDTDDAFNDGLVLRTKNGTWVDLILQASANPGDIHGFTHVIHKHGSKTWRIGQGHGIWNYTSVAQAIQERPELFNLVNPGYRDTWLTAADDVSWTVLRYYVDNPGPWFFHCHIEIHQSGGMGMVIMDGVDAWPEVPEEYEPGHNGFKTQDVNTSRYV